MLASLNILRLGHYLARRCVSVSVASDGSASEWRSSSLSHSRGGRTSCWTPLSHRGDPLADEAIIVAIRLPCRRCGFARLREGNMKLVSAAALALIGCLAALNSANAQGAAMKTTPTTRILAIGTINSGLLSYRRKFGKLSTST